MRCEDAPPLQRLRIEHNFRPLPAWESETLIPQCRTFLTFFPANQRYNFRYLNDLARFSHALLAEACLGPKRQMLSKCANPLCSASFRYFHEGRLFRIEVPSRSAEDVQTARPAAHVEFFWLCDRCTPQMTLQHDGRGNVSVTHAAHDLQEAS